MRKTKMPELRCPMGHGGDDVFELLLSSGQWWPVCVRCLMEPPGAARWHPEAAESATDGSAEAGG